MRARRTVIPESICQRINTDSRDPRSTNPQDYANRKDEGVFLVPKAGEMLYHLKKQPKWAGGQ